MKPFAVAACPAAVTEGGAPACVGAEEPSLLAHGWTRRFVGDPRMIEESTALYTRLGFEVMVVPLDGSKVEDACSGCAVTLRSFGALYTRRPAE